VCAAGAYSPAVVVVATQDGGTGALLRRPSRVINTAFGQSGSASGHLRLAAAVGIRPVKLDVPNLAFDVDTPSDLRALDGKLPRLGPVNELRSERSCRKAR
jgi:2-phospho-L-lactate guanylyltransferase (CobY/MobA/RfbA family)